MLPSWGAHQRSMPHHSSGITSVRFRLLAIAMAVRTCHTPTLSCLPKKKEDKKKEEEEEKKKKKKWKWRWMGRRRRGGKEKEEGEEKEEEYQLDERIDNCLSKSASLTESEGAARCLR